MSGSTSNRDYPYPTLTDPPHIPEDVQALADAIDSDMHENVVLHDDEFAVGDLLRIKSLDPVVVESLDKSAYQEAGVSAPKTALRLPGVSGNYVSTPDHDDLDITDNLDLRAGLIRADWTAAPLAIIRMVNKFTTISNQRAYGLDLDTDRTLRFAWSTNGAGGASTTTLNSSATVPNPGAGQELWMRATFEGDVPGYRVIFYTGPTSDGPWTQLGSTRTGSASSIFASTAVLEVGSLNDGTSALTVATHTGAQVRDGLDVTVVAYWRGDAPMGPRYRDSAGKIWTINGSAWSWEVA